MPSVRLNEEELEAMLGLPMFARCLYVFGLRPYMDYRTGAVGIVRGVSWQSIAEALYVEPHQGETDSGTPDKSRVRRAAARLEKAGLVVMRSEGKRLIFQCLLADTDQSASNKPDTNPTQTRHTHPDTAKPNNGAARDKEPDTNPTHPKQSKPDTPPVSGIRSQSSRSSVSTSLRSVEPQDQKTSAGVAKRPATAKAAPISAETWSAYARAYQRRYGVEPVRNATVNGQLANFVKRLGADEAPAVAAFYVASNQRFYVGAKHPVSLLLRDAEGLRTEWATGRTVTETQARQVDRRQSNADAFAALIAEAEAMEESYER